MDELKINPTYEKIIEDLLVNRYSVVDEFFSPEKVAALRTNLLKKYEDKIFKKSAIGNQLKEKIASEVRGDFILWLNETHSAPAEVAFFAQIKDFVDYLNRTCYMGIADSEFHYAVYPPGTSYRRHLDTFQNDSRRKLSIVCYLNDEDWKPEYGGELAIYLNDIGNEKVLNVYPLQGRMVIFESMVLEHEVKPVNRERLSITGWLKTRS